MNDPAPTSYRVRGGDGREFGPVGQPALDLWVRESRVAPATLVWSSADNAWRPARERRELDAAFAGLREANVPPVVGPPLNALSVWSFVLAQFGLCCGFPAIPAIVCGIVSLRQIPARGERGRGLAVSGIVLGVCGLLLGVMSLVLWVMILSLDPEALQQILDEQLRQLEQAGRS
jgi:hypothetical protein